jgi:hypothetical protein
MKTVAIILVISGLFAFFEASQQINEVEEMKGERGWETARVVVSWVAVVEDVAGGLLTGQWWSLPTDIGEAVLDSHDRWSFGAKLKRKQAMYSKLLLFGLIICPLGGVLLYTNSISELRREEQRRAELREIFSRVDSLRSRIDTSILTATGGLRKRRVRTYALYGGLLIIVLAIVGVGSLVHHRIVEAATGYVKGRMGKEAHLVALRQITQDEKGQLVVYADFKYDEDESKTGIGSSWELHVDLISGKVGKHRMVYWDEQGGGPDA